VPRHRGMRFPWTLALATLKLDASECKTWGHVTRSDVLVCYRMRLAPGTTGKLCLASPLSFPGVAGHSQSGCSCVRSHMGWAHGINESIARSSQDRQKQYETISATTSIDGIITNFLVVSSAPLHSRRDHVEPQGR
jgi:hypothetical protein